MNFILDFTRRFLKIIGYKKIKIEEYKYKLLKLYKYHYK